MAEAEAVSLQAPAVQEALAALDRAAPLLSLLGMVGDGLTDTMVERGVANLTRVSLLLDRLTGPGVERLLGRAAEPDAVAGLGALLDRVGQIDGLLAAVGVLTDGVTDAMVERGVRNLTRISLLLDRLTTPEGETLIEGLLAAGPALAAVVEKLAELERSGRLQRMLELLDFVGVLADSLTESMVQRLVGFLSGLMEMASDSGGLTSQLRRVSREAVADADRDGRVLGLFGLLAALKDPEMQRGIKLCLAMTRRAPQVLDRS